MRKLRIAEILKRWLLVAKKVPYKFPNDIPLQMLTLRVVNGRFIFCQNTRTADLFFAKILKWP